MLIFGSKFSPILQQLQPVTPSHGIFEAGGKEEFVHTRWSFVDAISVNI